MTNLEQAAYNYGLAREVYQDAEKQNKDPLLCKALMQNMSEAATELLRVSEEYFNKVESEKKNGIGK